MGVNFATLTLVYYSFSRSVTLPGEVDASKVDAKFKNGVLTITMPKTAQAQAKRITVYA